MYHTNDRSLLFIAVSIFCMSLAGCSDVPDNLDELSLATQAIYQPDRPSDDRRSDKRRHPVEVLEFAGVEPGMKVVDLLGGGGYYTELLSFMVGDSGQVYLQNNSLFLNFSADEVDARLEGDRLANVRRLDSEFADLQLPDNVDMIFMGLSFHDIYVPREDPILMADPPEFFAQIKASLKPGGKLLIIDHAAAAGSGIETTPKLHRIDEAWTRDRLEGEGFVFEKSLEVLRNPDDDYAKSIWADGIMGRTDRFVHLYEWPESGAATQDQS